MTATATRRIDPRIRQRRIAVQRNAGRRRLRRLVVLGLVVVAVGGVIALTRSPLLAVRHLRVQGASQTPAAAVIAASGIHTGEPIFEVSTGSARRAIAALPWVKSVSVQRSLPGTVVVHITERSPAAAVALGGGRWAVLDATGRVLEVASAEPPGLVVVSDASLRASQALRPGADLSVPGDVLALAAAVPSALRTSVASVSNGPAGLELRLQGGGVARLGDGSDLAAKLVSVQAVLTSQGVTPSCVAVLDVTVATAPALTSRPGCA